MLDSPSLQAKFTPAAALKSKTPAKLSSKKLQKFKPQYTLRKLPMWGKKIQKTKKDNYFEWPTQM